jgi:hypothetical protein
MDALARIRFLTFPFARQSAQRAHGFFPAPAPPQLTLQQLLLLTPLSSAAGQKTTC